MHAVVGEGSRYPEPTAALEKCPREVRYLSSRKAETPMKQVGERLSNKEGGRGDARWRSTRSRSVGTALRVACRYVLRGTATAVSGERCERESRAAVVKRYL